MRMAEASGSLIAFTRISIDRENAVVIGRLSSALERVSHKCGGSSWGFNSLFIVSEFSLCWSYIRGSL